jgi:hypothetical protein
MTKGNRRAVAKLMSVEAYLRYPTTIRVVSSTSTFTVFSVSISAWFSTVLCATASIVLTWMVLARRGCRTHYLLLIGFCA